MGVAGVTSGSGRQKRAAYTPEGLAINKPNEDKASPISRIGAIKTPIAIIIRNS
jgi:hypothetical protein